MKTLNLVQFTVSQVNAKEWSVTFSRKGKDEIQQLRGVSDPQDALLRTLFLWRNYWKPTKKKKSV